MQPALSNAHYNSHRAATTVIVQLQLSSCSYNSHRAATTVIVQLQQSSCSQNNHSADIAGSIHPNLGNREITPHLLSISSSFMPHADHPVFPRVQTSATLSGIIWWPTPFPFQLSNVPRLSSLCSCVSIQQCFTSISKLEIPIRSPFFSQQVSHLKFLFHIIIIIIIKKWRCWRRLGKSEDTLSIRRLQHHTTNR